MGPYFFCALAEWIARLNCIQRYFVLRMTAIRKAVWDGELPLLAACCPTPTPWRPSTRVDPLPPVVNGSFEAAKSQKCYRGRCE